MISQLMIDMNRNCVIQGSSVIEETFSTSLRNVMIFCPEFFLCRKNVSQTVLNLRNSYFSCTSLCVLGFLMQTFMDHLYQK